MISTEQGYRFQGRIDTAAGNPGVVELPKARLTLLENEQVRLMERGIVFPVVKRARGCGSR